VAHRAALVAKVTVQDAANALDAVLRFRLLEQVGVA
jgi:hypothetical protein